MSERRALLLTDLVGSTDCDELPARSLNRRSRRKFASVWFLKSCVTWVVWPAVCLATCVGPIASACIQIGVMGDSTRYVIPGSWELQFPGARAVGAATPQERFEVSVRVRAKRGAKDIEDTLDDTPPAQRHYLSREEDAAAHGSDPRDLAKVAAFAQANGLAVVETSAERRTVVLSGTASQFEKAFDVQLQQYEYDGGTYRGRSGTISVPAELAGTVEGVFGLDNRPQAKPHL